jgi:hypothetical protein
MRTKFTLLAILAVAFFSTNAQVVPNSSFETWTSPNNPDGWSTYSSGFGANIGLAFKDTADKVVGNASIKITCDSVPGQPNYGVIAGLVSTGSLTFGAQGPAFTGIPFAFRPDTLFFAYKYQSPGGDTAVLSLSFTKNGSSALVQNAPAVGVYLDPAAQWTLAYVPINSFYANGTIVPDTLLLRFLAGNRKKTVGTTLHVDGVFFSTAAVTGVNEVENNIAVTVFPNPVVDQLNIQSSENMDGNKIIITDMTGAIVRIRPLTSTLTSIELSDVASGTYVYRIADKGGRFIKQDRFTVAK